MSPLRCGWTARGRADHGRHGDRSRQVGGEGIDPYWSRGGLQSGRLARRRGVVPAPHRTTHGT
jgi:hypothetical protein